MKKIEEFNNLILEGLKEGAAPGANYAIVFKDKMIFGSFGKRSIYPNVEENSIDTIYDMASLTKIICTTTCALRLIEQGKLRLYAPVKKYLPNFKFDNISIWNLMTHTSGLPEGVPHASGLKTPQEVYEKIDNLELKFTPGTKIHYSDIGYILLGKVIESITKKNLNDFAKEEIFDKLNMIDTTFLPTFSDRIAPTEMRDDTVFKGIVRGVVHDETSYALGGVAGHAGLFSTVKDVANYLSMLLNDGMFNNERFLSKAIIDLLYTPQVKEYTGVSAIPEARSLGFVIKGPASSSGVLTSEKTILHTGFTGTNIFVDRVNEVAFVLLTNRVHPTRKNILHMDLRARLANFLIASLDDIKNNL